MNMGRSGGVNMKLYVRKIQKLVNGSGIKHPQVNAVFCEGHPLKLTDDVETLIHEAKQWFATHGPDSEHGVYGKTLVEASWEALSFGAPSPPMLTNSHCLVHTFIAMGRLCLVCSFLLEDS